MDRGARDQLGGRLGVVLGLCGVVAAAATAVPAGGAGAAPAPVAAAAPAAAGDRAAAGRSVGRVALPPVPKGTEVVADNGILRMAVNMKDGWFQIVDERNGAIWTSGPQNPGAYAQNNHWQMILQSDFEMGRTTTERQNALTDLSAVGQYPDDGGQLTVHRIPNGVALEYNYTQDAIRFEGDLTINGASLVASVPWNKVHERKCPRFTPPPPKMALILFYFPPECYELVDIHFLPAFGYGQPGQPGYAVIPDGSGAIINYAQNHPIYTVDYMMPIYGDPTQIPGFDQWYPQATMPIFGQVHLDPKNPAGNAAILGVVQGGAEQANIIMVPAGRQANLYLASADFIYRPLFQEIFEGSGPGTGSARYAWHPIPGNRSETIFFLAGPHATYAGLALRYRQYLIDQQHAKPLTPQPQAPFILHVLNGARDANVLFDPLQVATTFPETQQMIEALQAQGVKSLRVTLEGWMRSGIDWLSMPFIWPPDGAYGGAGGLRALAQWGRAHHAPIVLAVNMLEAYKSGLGFNLRADSIHFEDQLPMLNLPILNIKRDFLISPDVANHVLLPPLLRHIARVDASGMDFNYFARNVYPNWGNLHTLSRAGAAGQWMQMVDAARRTLGDGGVQGGNTYAVGHADYFYNAPTNDSGFDYETRAIPFWEMAVHGLALYSGVESNLRSDPTQQELQMIEDGALPAWELTWQPANVLRYAPEYNFLYSSQFSQWEPQAVAEYLQEVQRGYSRLAYVAITDNEQIAPGVHETDYADGTRVIVNYNQAAVKLPQYHGLVVPGLDYRVIGGGAS